MLYQIDAVLPLIMTAVFFLLMMGALIIIYKIRYKKVPPGKAMIVYGKGTEPHGSIIVIRGGKFIIPIVQGYDFIPLETWSSVVEAKRIPTGSDPDKGVDLKLSLRYGIGDEEKDLRSAAGHFVRKEDEEVHRFIEETLTLHTLDVARDVFRKRPLDQLADDRSSAGEIIRRGVQNKVGFMGVKIRSLTIEKMDILDRMARS
ncbi:MAG: SPFH domain-containing protein [Thermoplasmatota archaeon]